MNNFLYPEIPLQACETDFIKLNNLLFHNVSKCIQIFKLLRTFAERETL